MFRQQQNIVGLLIAFFTFKSQNPFYKRFKSSMSNSNIHILKPMIIPLANYFFSFQKLIIAIYIKPFKKIIYSRIFCCLLSNQCFLLQM